MNILSRLFGGGDKRGSPAPSDDFWYSHVGMFADGSVRVTPETAMTLTAVYACVRVLTESVASLPLIVYRRREDGGKERAIDHPLYRLLHDLPNGWQTSMEWREMLTGHIALRGSAYCEIVTARNGDIDALIPLHPDRVKPLRLKNGRLAFEVQTNTSAPRVLTQNEVFRVIGLSGDGVTGLSPVSMASRALGLAISTENFGTSLFKNGARPGGVLRHPGKLNEEAAKRLKSSWDSSYGGMNSGKTAVLEEGMEWTQISMSNEDAQYLQSRKFQVSEIARIFRIPPHMIGDLDRATFSNIEQQSIDFVVNTLRPWLVRWEQCINRDLLTETDRQNGIFAEFLVDGLLRGDMAARYQSYAQGRQNGWLSANDIRRIENMNPVDGGDIYLVPLNMVPADQAGQDFVSSDPQRSHSCEHEHRSVEYADLAPAQVRSMKERQRIQRSFKGIFEDAAARWLKREVSELRKLSKKNLRDGKSDFEASMLTFYDELQPYIERQLLPIVNSVAENIHAAAAAEIGAAQEMPEVLRTFAAAYAATASIRYVSKSKRDIYKRLDADDAPETAIEALFAHWEETRAENVAKNEAVRSAAALSRESYKSGGVKRIRWVSTGENCELCRAMNGKIVGVEQDFLSEGETLTPSEGSPMVSTRNIKHPPLHGSCDCALVAER